MNTSPVTAEPAVTTLVLLQEPPPGIGGHLALIAEKLRDLVESRPALRQVPALEMNINGAALRFTAVPQPLTDDRLASSATQSPVRQLVEPALAAHRGALEITLTAVADLVRDLTTLSNVTAAVAGNEDALGVYLPAQQRLTTTVLYCGEVDQRPAQTWFWSPAMWLDQQQGTSHAFTEGLALLGGLEVQYSSVPAEPAQAFRTLRSAVADVLETGSVPRAGLGVDIDGAAHQFVPGTDLIRSIQVLDLVPAPTSR